MRYDAGFNGCRPGAPEEAFTSYSPFFEHLRKDLAAPVIPRQAGDGCMRTERHNIMGHIGSASEKEIFFCHLNNGDRRFRRYPGYLSPDITVEDQVPDNEYSFLFKPAEDFVVCHDS